MSAYAAVYSRRQRRSAKTRVCPCHVTFGACTECRVVLSEKTPWAAVSQSKHRTRERVAPHAKTAYATMGGADSLSLVVK